MYMYNILRMYSIQLYMHIQWENTLATLTTAHLIFQRNKAHMGKL